MKDMLINVVPPPSPPNASAQAPPAAEGGRVEPPSRAEPGKDMPPRSAPELPELDLSKVVESLNDYLQSVKRDLQFSVNDVTGRTVIRVLESTSQEVIREIPPESVQALAEYLRNEGGIDSFGLAEKV